MKKFESERNPLFSVILGLVPRIHTKHYSLDTRVTPEYDNNNLLPQCAPDATGFLSDVYKRGTRAQKTRTLETVESGVDKVISSCEKNPNVHKTYMNFLRQRKTALDAPLHAVSSGRSMIEMLGVLAIIGVLSVGGIAGYSKAMTKFKINKTMSQIAEIATNVRTLYAQQKDFNGLNNETAVQMGIVPDSLTTSTGPYNTTISNVFGGNISIENVSTSRPSYPYNDAFRIVFSDLGKEACIALGTANWGTIESSGVVGITIGYVSYFLEEALERGKGNCTKGDLYNNGDGYYACSGSLPLSPATAAKYCDNPEAVSGAMTGFGIMFTK